MFIELLQNITLLFALSMIYGLIMLKYPPNTFIGKAIIGVLFGLSAIFGMTYPFTLSPGVVFDGRSILMCLAGFLGGWISGTIAALMAVPYRLFLGGSGALTEAGVIIATAAIGAGFHYLFLRKPHLRTNLSIYLMGLSAHIAMLLLMFTLPGDLPGKVLKNIGLPVITLYPLIVLLIVYYLDQQTKIHLSQKALKEKEDMSRAFFLNSLDAMLITSPDGGVHEANPAACAMLGRSEAEIRALGRDGLVNINDPRLEQLLKERAEKGKAIGELTMIRADGSVFPVEISSALFNDRFGNIRTAMIIRDITDRKKAENELREKETQYRNLADSGLALIWTSGVDKLCNYFNEPWLKFTGRSLEQELGDGWAEGVHPDDLERCVKTYTTAFDKREPFDMEYRIRHVSGEYRWIRDMGKPTYNSLGEFTGYIGHCFDITEHKKAESAKNRLLKILENSVNEIYIFDPDTLIFEYANKGALRNLGYTHEEILRMTPVDIKPEFTESSFRETIEPLLKRDKEELVFETIHKRADGTTYPVEVHLQIVDIEERRALLAVILDITERKKAEEKLRESEEIFRMVFESANVGKSITLPSGEINVNEAFCDMLGYSKDDLIDKKWQDLTPQEEISQIEHKLGEMISGKTDSVRFEKRYIHKSGKHIWCDVSVKLRRDKEGNPLHFITTIVDITDKKSSETLLKNSYDLINKIAAQIPGMIYQFKRKPDGSYCLPFSSERINEIFGCSPEDVKDDFSHIIKAIHPEDLDIVLSSIEDSALLISPWRCEFRTQIPSKPEEWQWIWAHSLPEKLEDGSVIWHGFATDITERKAAERALKEAETRYHLLFNHSPDGIIIIEPESMKIIEFNETALSQLGYTREEFSAMSLTDINAFSDSEEIKLKRHLNEALTKGRVDYEILHRTKTGEVKTIHITMMATELSGRPAVHCVARDITERCRLQDQLRHAQKLESIGQLAGGIAHDFNNILNVIIGYAGLIESHAAKDNIVKRFAEEILSAGMRGASLTRQILAFSRKQPLNMKPEDINEQIKNLLNMLRRLVREDISIDICLHKEPLIVMADADQLGQVLINLTTNARDAMPSGGTIHISTERFLMGEDFVETHGYGQPGEYAVIKFSDTGVGMDNETRLHIFDPFFTTKEIGKGTGLGLAVAHGIIKQHSGYISVYSEPGMGTSFIIYIPLSESSQKGDKFENIEWPKGGHETILIAEDEEAIRKLTVTLLSQAGYKVIEAQDGEEAVTKFTDNSKTIDLVILDGVMPKKNGGEAFELIKGVRSDIKAIFMSGYADGSISISDIKAKGAVYLQKPIKPYDLLRTVRQTLDASQR